ncbi:hypothetical protein [uncultured Mucilaginibacter sp.]|uniref:hypothetical protein n=1 Tax=uncultured Mucilaginibacter sp. TaxID=797541 RepID=UPI0025CDADB8|nr:hypothetical protein [uncultured Mucilaginibacter sp.]
MKEIRILKLKRLAIRLVITLVLAALASQAGRCLYYAVQLDFNSMIVLMVVLIAYLCFSIWLAWKVRIPL